MSHSGARGSGVLLATVDEATLEQLVHAATTGAPADDITPRTTPGQEWTPQREEWLREFHRARREGLAG